MRAHDETVVCTPLHANGASTDGPTETHEELLTSGEETRTGLLSRMGSVVDDKSACPLELLFCGLA